MSAAPIEALFATGIPAGLGPGTRSGTWSSTEASARTKEACAAAKVVGPAEAAFRALVLVWHDHLDEAHGIVQDMAGADAAWVHGIIHRREPDYSNARYWFHRVGSHPALEALADSAAPVLAAHPALPQRLIRDGRWDSFAFIEAVTAASRATGVSTEVPLLSDLQRLETLALARHLVGR